MEKKQRKNDRSPDQKHPEQNDQNPDQRNRSNRPGEANIDHDDRRPGQQTEKRRQSGERDAVEGEGETGSENAKL